MKKVHGFSVQINGKEFCKAGFEAESILTCILHAIRRKDQEEEELYLSVSGADTKNNLRGSWGYDQDLKKGDKITFEVIEAPFDKPQYKEGKFIDPDKELKQKIAYYHKLKEELKDHI